VYSIRVVYGHDDVADDDDVHNIALQYQELMILREDSVLLQYSHTNAYFEVLQ